MNRLAQKVKQKTEASGREKINIVTVGHVDHGKSTVIGRLLADTGSLPKGKLEQVKAQCAKTSKPFEYAFLLDALKNEQSQGITIDTARCFFKTAKRDYIIHDAPGHIEFLKNMVTGAARAEAALLVIDAHEGVQENSKRHGFLVSMLGVGQVVVLINKMDLVGYNEDVFNSIKEEYLAFLNNLGVNPIRFIPVSAREGVNITKSSSKMAWYKDSTVLEQVDLFEKEESRDHHHFRMPVQDIYKFTAQGDSRRIVAGTIETGTINVGDEVIFLPSGKKSKIKTIEGFNARPQKTVKAGQALGFTLEEEIYIKAGEMMVKQSEVAPKTSNQFRANLFWMGRAPLIKGKRYKLKIGAQRVGAELADIINVLDASELSTIKGKEQIDRHDVAECVLEATHPVAFDRLNDLEITSRLVIIDDYEIAGCGTILEESTQAETLLAKHVQAREISWDKGYVTPETRASKYEHPGKFIIFVGSEKDQTHELAKKLELKLFLDQLHTYYLSISVLFDHLDTEDKNAVMTRDEQIYKLGELARIMTDSGLLFITTLTDVDDYDLEKLKLLNDPNELFVVNVGQNNLNRFSSQVTLDANPNISEAIEAIVKELNTKGIVPDFQI